MRTTNGIRAALWALLVGVCGLALATDPPSLMNYQGVLRNGGAAADGNFDMVFRFFDADVDGEELLVDEHLGAGSGGVAVTGGLFNVVLGSGTLADGSGPGSFLSLGDVFRRRGEIYMEVEIAGETLSPRTRVVSAPYSMGDTPADGACYDSENQFVDCGNGTVTDTATGLIWLKDASCLGAVPGPDGWPAANAIAAALEDGECGLTDKSTAGDWRLPTKAEWETILSMGVANGCPAPFLPNAHSWGCWSEGDPFTGVQTFYYWASTPLGNGPGSAYMASMQQGVVGYVGKETGALLVWPVRGSWNPPENL